jgi:hypothetical protein
MRHEMFLIQPFRKAHNPHATRHENKIVSAFNPLIGVTSEQWDAINFMAILPHFAAEYEFSALPQTIQYLITNEIECGSITIKVPLSDDLIYKKDKEARAKAKAAGKKYRAPAIESKNVTLWYVVEKSRLDSFLKTFDDVITLERSCRNSPKIRCGVHEPDHAYSPSAWISLKGWASKSDTASFFTIDKNLYDSFIELVEACKQSLSAKEA